MSRLLEIVQAATAQAHGPDVGSKAWLDTLTDDERAYFIRYGCVPRKRPRMVRPDGASILEGRRGLSVQAVHLFEKAQKAGGTLELRALRSWARVDDLQRLVDELAHFDLVVRIEAPRQLGRLRRPEGGSLRTGRPVARRFSEDGAAGGPAFRIAEGYEDVMLVPAGWSRWS